MKDLAVHRSFPLPLCCRCCCRCCCCCCCCCFCCRCCCLGVVVVRCYAVLRLPYCCCFCSKPPIQSINFDLQSLYVEIRIDHNTNVLKIMFFISRPTIGDRLEFCFCVRFISRGSRSYGILQRQARSFLMSGRWLKREDVEAHRYRSNKAFSI